MSAHTAGLPPDLWDPDLLSIGRASAQFCTLLQACCFLTQGGTGGSLGLSLEVETGNLGKQGSPLWPTTAEHAHELLARCFHCS